MSKINELCDNMTRQPYTTDLFASHQSYIFVNTIFNQKLLTYQLFLLRHLALMGSKIILTNTCIGQING